MNNFTYNYFSSVQNSKEVFVLYYITPRLNLLHFVLQYRWRKGTEYTNKVQVSHKWHDAYTDAVLGGWDENNLCVVTNMDCEVISEY
jgi:hypothetical protein